MTVNPMDLGTAVCHAIMRDLNDKPILLQGYDPQQPMNPPMEATTAGEEVIMAQWCVVLLPTLDFVGVRAHLRYLGGGLYEQAVLRPGEEPFECSIFVRYPEDKTAITGPEYEADLRAAVEEAVAAVEEDRARVLASAGKG
jgi:hypothetical protein